MKKTSYTAPSLALLFIADDSASTFIAETGARIIDATSKSPQTYKLALIAHSMKPNVPQRIVRLEDSVVAEERIQL